MNLFFSIESFLKLKIFFGYLFKTKYKDPVVFTISFLLSVIETPKTHFVFKNDYFWKKTSKKRMRVQLY